MAKIKTSELIGGALDWAVAKCNGVDYRFIKSTGGDYNGNWWWEECSYSHDWAQGGPIIDREHIATWTTTGGVVWHSKKDGWGQFQAVDGPTALIAAMRCYVASVLGSEVDIPDTLI